MEVTETRREPQILRDADGKILAVGAEEIAAHYFKRNAVLVNEEASRGVRRTFAERRAAEAPPAARTALEEEGEA
jgi:hypothetical protein